MYSSCKLYGMKLGLFLNEFHHFFFFFFLHGRLPSRCQTELVTFCTNYCTSCLHRFHEKYKSVETFQTSLVVIYIITSNQLIVHECVFSRLFVLFSHTEKFDRANK